MLYTLTTMDTITSSTTPPSIDEHHPTKWFSVYSLPGEDAMYVKRFIAFLALGSSESETLIEG